MTTGRRGLLLVISSPSGAGKTSLARRLIQSEGDLVLSISATTRAPRAGEQDGREYHFTSSEAFEAMVEAGAFLEWAEVHENRYGTPREPVERRLAQGGDVLFDIDWQGAEAIAAALPEDTVRVFILPPSMDVLRQRLTGRASDSPDVIARRMGRAKDEIEKWIQYDYVIVNDDFERAFGKLASIYRAERERRARNPWLQGFVRDLLAE